MHNEIKLTCKIALAVFILSFAGGCAHYRDLPAGTKTEVCPVVVEKQEITVPSVAAEEAPPADYVIGRNDVLFVSINGRSEYTVGATGANSKVQGSRVDGNGDINLPLVGAVRVAGLTVGEAQKRIEEAGRKYFTNPWAVVEIAEYKSRPVYLLGQFKVPGTYYLDRPLNLLQGIALGNGFDNTANLRGARLTRDKKIVAVDVYDLLTRGDATQNVWLKPGDTIYIPDSLNRQVFVFGAVKKAGPLPIPSGGLNLAQAIAAADLRDSGYDIKYVRVIRPISTTRGELLVVDFDKMMRGETLPFQLMDGDVVYVPKSAFGTWNDALADLLPSLQAISAVLQPFVNIKFLSQ
jgi:polysaccharide biosynthesis/export protein